MNLQKYMKFDVSAVSNSIHMRAAETNQFEERSTPPQNALGDKVYFCVNGFHWLINGITRLIDGFS